MKNSYSGYQFKMIVLRIARIRLHPLSQIIPIIFYQVTYGNIQSNYVHTKVQTEAKPNEVTTIQI